MSSLFDLDKDERSEIEERANLKGMPIEERVKAKPSTLARILAVGTCDYFDWESARIGAASNHEKAERVQAANDAAAKPTEAARERANEAWSLAKTSWSSYYLSRIALEFTIEQRIEQARVHQITFRIPLLEAVHRDTQRILHSKLRLSECILHTQGREEAKAYLASVKNEIEGIEKKGLLSALVAQTLAELRQHPSPQANALARRVDLLERDWQPTGTYYWYKRQIDALIAGWR